MTAKRAQAAGPSVSGRANRPSGPHLVHLADVKPEKVHWLWYPYIPLGKLTSIEGDPGLGKSWITCDIAAAVSNGTPLPGQPGTRLPSKVLLLSAEDGLADTIRPRMDALGANVENIDALDGAITLDAKGLATLDAALERVKPAVVFIDPLVAYAGADIDMHRANQVRELMHNLALLAEKHGCAIVTVRHLRKSRGGSAIYQGQGSIDITAACRSVVMVGLDHGSRVMAHAKCNLVPLGPSLAFTINGNRFQWGGQVRTTADDLAAEPEDRDTRSATEEAMDFLRQVLAKGPMSSAELEEAAKQVGIATRTLSRARRQFGVKAKQEDGHWLCSLPPESQIAEEQKVGRLAA